MANTPTRSFRCSDELWRASQVRAREKGLSMSGILVNALKDWNLLEDFIKENGLDDDSDVMDDDGCETIVVEDVV